MNSNVLDGVYRAAVWGLQAGVAGVAIVLVMGTLGLTAVPSCMCAVFVLTFVGGALLLLYRDTIQVQVEGKGVLVTGCDSGFGYDLALHLHDLGFVVFAGCLQEQAGAGSRSLKEKETRNLHVLQLDVTSDEQVGRVVQYITDNLPPQGLWGVVNNAGWTTIGHVEWVPIATYKKIMDVNVWGMLRVIQGVLPLIRKSKGRVVNVASALGRQCAINKSAYGITKYGVEALSDCLRFEVRRFGVHVCIIEPGNFVNATKCYTEESLRRTAAGLWSHMSEQVRTDYTKEYFDAIINNKIKYSTCGTSDKRPVIEAMSLALLHRYPHPRYQPMEPSFKLRTWVNTHLPEWMYEMVRP